MLDLTKPVQTRSGHKVRILATDVNDTQPVVGIVTYEDRSESVECWGCDGRFVSGGDSTDLDLVNVPAEQPLRCWRYVSPWYSAVAGQDDVVLTVELGPQDSGRGV